MSSPPNIEYREERPQDISRQKLGLPSQHAIYFCPHRLSKYHPDFDFYLRDILEADTNGHIVLLFGETTLISEKIKERMKRNIGSELFKRMIFLPRQNVKSYYEYLSAATAAVCNDWQQGTDTKGTYTDVLGRFYAENMSYRERIFPITKPLKESLLIIAETNISPDRIFLDFESFSATANRNETFHALTNMFSQSIIFGNGWEHVEIQESLKNISAETHHDLEFRELTWRLSPLRQEK
jgi:hypothetical protein